MIALLAPLLVPIVDKLVGRIPDPNERARAKEEAEAAIIVAANQAALAQIDLNKQEAAHKSVFVAGWRPFIGWVCGAALAWHFIAGTVARWGAAIWWPDVTMPMLDTEPLFQLVIAMLGLSGWRTIEKVKGVSREK